MDGDGWVTVFPQLSEADIEMYSVLELGRLICPAVARPAIGFQVVDSDFFSWWVFDSNGKIVGESVADPENGELSVEQQTGLAGNPAAISALASERGVTPEEVLQALRRAHPGTLEGSVTFVGRLLGIRYAPLVYQDIVDLTEMPKMFDDDEYNWRNEFIFVGET